MGKQLFINNFETVFAGPVKDSPTSQAPATELDYGVLRLSDGAAAKLINPQGGDYYLLTAFKRSGVSESAVEVLAVTAVDNAVVGECRITVTRAQDGTQAQAYVAGDRVEMRLSAAGARNFAQRYELDAKVDKVAGKGLSTEDYTAPEKAKLAGIEAGANAYVHPSGDGNQHVPPTGTGSNGKVLMAGSTAGSAAWQPLPTAPVTTVAGKSGAVTLDVADVTGLQTALDGKVDKEPGKGLSTEDYTTSDKAKVAGLGTAAAANLTTSEVDTTAGRVLKVGDFGLGEYTPSLTKSQENTLLNGRSTFYSTQDESDLLPYAGALQIGYTYQGYATQIASSMGVSVPILKVRVLNNNVWGQPVTLLHTNNLAQGVGGSTEYPMSQAATTTALNSLQPGPWIDLRPYLNPAFIFEPARAGKNNFPAGRVNNGFIELRGVVNYNVSAAAPASGVMLTLPPELRPAMTMGLVGFVDVASPLYFGYATYIVVGATPYNMPGAQHGELRIINMPGGPATVTTQSFSLDGLRFAQG